MRAWVVAFSLVAFALVPQAMAAGTTYDVGPGLTYTNLSSVPWTSLRPNDLVNIHYQPGGYHEIILLSNSGASNAPITIHGVPDPVTGALPVLDGSNAVAAANIPWRSPVFDTLGVIVISRYMGTAWGYIPSWITIENLHIQNADRSLPMTPSTGTPTKFSSFACGIYVEFAQHLTIRNCEINGAENGFFCNSKDSSPEELSGDILIENCYIHHNGYLNDYGVHNLYTEAMGITLQNNLIGPLRAGACGEQWKNRSAGTRIRYNQWIMGPGPGTCMWLESPQGGQGVIDLDPSYKTNWCYGNVIYNPPNSSGSTMIRFDALGIEGVPRSGTLFFYNNTVVNHANQSVRWSSAVFDLPRHDEVLSTGIHDLLDCRNNIIANFPATSGSAPSTLYLLTSDDGNINFGSNWISRGTQWFVLPYLKTNFCGLFTGTNQIAFGTSQNNPGFVDLTSTNLHLMSNSVCIDMAGLQAPQIAGTPDDITQEYVYPAGSKARMAIGAGLDLGAFEGSSTNTPPPPSAGALQFSTASMTQSESGGSVTLTVNRVGGTNGAASVGFATVDGTAVAPAQYASTNGTLAWAAGDATPRFITVPIRYTPGFLGDRLFAVALSTPSGGATLGSPTLLTVTIAETDPSPPNYPPIAIPQSIRVTENTATPIILDGHDGDNDSLSFGIVTAPTKGTLIGTPPNLTFTPSTNVTGPDWFAFTVSDGKVTSAPAMVQIGINAPTNTPPTVSLLTPLTHTWFVAPTNVFVSASITAPDGVKRVDFFDGTNNIGSASNAPYAFTWTNPVPGIHTLFAKGFANSGARAFSAPSVVTVLNGTPQLTIQQTSGHPALALPADGWLLEESTNIAGGWVLSPGVNGTLQGTNQQKFYRLVLPW